MITPAQMYWLTRLDNICAVSTVVLVIAILLPIALLVIGLLVSSTSEECLEYLRDIAKPIVGIILPIVAISTLCVTFVPSTREMAAIMIVPKIANNEKVRDAGNKLYDLAVEWMVELRPGKKESK